MRKIANKNQKNVIAYLILIVMVVLTFVIGVIKNNTFPVFNESLNVRLKESGKTAITLTVDKTKVNVQSKGEFSDLFSEYIKKLNEQSSDTDFIKVSDISENADSYKVKIETRRIDKIQGVGDSFLYGKGKEFADIESNLDTIDAFYSGIIRKPALARVYPDNTMKIWSLQSGDNNVKLKPISAKNEGDFDLDEFKTYLSKTNDKVLLFRLFDMKFIDKITLNVSGKIKYVSSQNVKVISKNSVEITPIKLKSTARILSEDKEITDEVEAFYGFIVFKENLSPISVAFICFGIELLVWFVICGILLGWFKTFFARKTFRKMCKYKFLYLMLVPGLACLIIFHYAPMFGLITAFQDYSLTEGFASEWVGLKYFYRIFTANTPYVYRIFRNTIFISLIRIGTNFPIILLFALFINSIKNTRVKSVMQTVSFIPYFLSWAAVAGLLYAIISDYGLLNSALIKLGIVKKGVNEPSWYSMPDAWWGILSISSLWKGMGWGTLIYISAMCNIDEELYEACALDGGGSFRKMITVTIPGIMPMICMQLILDSSSIMKDNYEQILALINGATGLSTTLQVIGQVSFDALSSGSGSSFGSATTYGLIQGVIGLILVFVSNRIVKKSDNPGII